MRTLNINLNAPPSPFALDEAASAIAQGAALVYATETLYGKGADAFNASAVQKVLAAKKRSDDKPTLVIIHSLQQLDPLAAEIPAAARKLMAKFWSRSVDDCFQSEARLPVELTKSSETIGVRILSNTFCRELLRLCHCPLTSTSANISREPVHRTIAEIRAALSAGFDLFLDAGTLPESKPSTRCVCRCVADKDYSRRSTLV